MSQILVPEMGESVTSARVARWLKQEGEHVAAGEAVVELETEKVDLEVTAEHAGVLERIHHREGEDVRIGEPLGDVGDAVPPVSPPAGQPPSPAQDVKPAPAAPARAASPPAPEPTNGHAARRADAEPQRDHPRPEPRPDRREERVRLSTRRQTIARRLVEAQRTAAILTTFNEIDMRALGELRARCKQAFATRHGVGLGLTGFFVTASIAALKAFPALNAELDGDELVLKRHYDIGVAVGAEEGLVVPVLRDADRMNLAEIERAIKGTAEKAAAKTLSVEDLRGGTFTITNGGVFGSLLSTPILNPPQVGILGLHKIDERPVVRDGQVAIRPMMYVALSYDHRVVDGREAVQFLARIKALIENPEELLLDA